MPLVLVLVLQLLLATVTGAPAAPPTASPLPRGAALFAHTGLVVEAWVNDADLQRGDLGDLSDFFASGFTPTFYGAPWWAPVMMADPRATGWSMSTVGSARFNVSPPPGAAVLTTNQTGHRDQLVSICLGDEDQYNTSTVTAWQSWAELAHAQEPGAIIHTNQWLGEWHYENYQKLLSTNAFDMIVIDNYAFPGGSPPGSEPRNTSAVSLIQACATIRYTSLHAAPSTIPFGYYLQGYETKPGYTLSAAQVRAYYYLPLAMGAKWLNMFRWAAPWVGFQGKQRTELYYTFQAANRVVAALSPLLSQLQTTKLERVGGFHIDPSTGEALPNKPPQQTILWPKLLPVALEFAPWQRWAAVANITARNLGTTNGGLAEDVLLCHFSPIAGASVPLPPGSTSREQAAYGYFALFNGLCPDKVHSTEPAAGEIEVALTLNAARVWEWGAAGGWEPLLLGEPPSGGNETKLARLAVGGGEARFLCVEK